MADAYCSSCGRSLPTSAQFCGGCGTPAGGAASDWDATQPDDATRELSPYRPAGPSYAGSDGGFAGGPPPPAPRPPQRSPWLVVGVVTLVVAVIAVGVILLVANSGGPSNPVAGPSGSTRASSSASASAAPSASASLAPTLTKPQIVTVTASATLTAPAGGGAEQPAPLSTSQLRSAYESGVPVDRSSYEGASADVFFSTPSRNIECYVSVAGDGVECAISRYDFPQPGPDCDNGAIVSIDGAGNATYSGCVTSTFAADGNTLSYGASITTGGYGCISQQVGISCVDLDTDTGFTLSRQVFVPVN